MAKVKKKPTKADTDRMIMGALCNFVNAETREYKVYMMMGSDRNDLMYLATHVKKAGVDMATALDVSIPFLKQRYPTLDTDTIKMAFDLYYPMEEYNREYRKWFTKK